MGTADEEIEWPAPLQELLDCSPEDDTKLRTRVLQEGFDQGCFLRLHDPEQVLRLTPHELLDFHLVMAKKEPGRHPEVEGDPFEDEPLQQTAIEGSDPGLVIISQRCDLIKSVQAEPLVEVASGLRIDDPKLISRAKDGTASHLVLLAEDDEGAWVGDLRLAGTCRRCACTTHRPFSRSRRVGPAGAWPSAWGRDGHATRCRLQFPRSSAA